MFFQASIVLSSSFIGPLTRITLSSICSTDQMGHIFVEKGMAREFMEALNETTDLDTLVCLLFTISDILDIDNSGTSFSPLIG